MRISDWSSDVCSSDLHDDIAARGELCAIVDRIGDAAGRIGAAVEIDHHGALGRLLDVGRPDVEEQAVLGLRLVAVAPLRAGGAEAAKRGPVIEQRDRSEENTSELQSLIRISYAVFCL